MASADILRAARARIEDPKHWTVDLLARNELGGALDARSPKAVCWCALGALQAETGNDSPFGGVEYDILNEASRSLFGVIAPVVNNKKGHAAILQVFDAAIAAAEAEAGR